MEKARLRRELGRLDTVCLLVAAIVVLDTLGAVAQDGAQTVTWIVVVAVLFFLPAGLVMAELGAAVPRQGGAYVWARLAFGPLAGSLVALAYWIEASVWVGGSLAITAVAVTDRLIVPLHGVPRVLLALGFIWAAVVLALAPLRARPPPPPGPRHPGRAARRRRRRALRRRLRRVRPAPLARAPQRPASRPRRPRSAASGTTVRSRGVAIGQDVRIGSRCHRTRRWARGLFAPAPPSRAQEGGTMPPEQDSPRARQLEALRRYVSELADQVEHPPEPRGRRRPPSRWLLLTALLVGLALVGGVLVGAVAWSDDRPSPARVPGDGSLSSAQSTSTSVAAATASAECKTAVDRANRGLASAVKLRNALAEQTKIMDDLLAGRIDRAAARRARTPPELTGQLQSARFDLALADYRKVVDQCRLQAP